MDLKTVAQEKVKVNVRSNHDGFAEVYLREGEAPKLLDEQPPVKVNIKGVLNAPAQFLLKRKHTLVSHECYAEADTDQMTVTLIINESDPYLRGQVEGRLILEPTLLKFGINTGHSWEPNELGAFLKMNRAFFEDKAKNMELVSNLLNFEARIDSKIENKKNEKGEFADSFSGVVNSNIPPKFRLQIPVFKGATTESIEVEFMPEIKGRAVFFQLYSPDAAELILQISEEAIHNEVKRLLEIDNELVIIYK